MAKLSAFGRVEVCTFTKTDSSPTLTSRTFKLRLMSDGVVLSKFDGVFTDGMKLTGTWKKKGAIAGWPKNIVDFIGRETFINKFKDYATKRGYQEG